MMISLKQARAEGKIDQFISERDEAIVGDRRTMEASLRALAGKSKAAPVALPRDCPDD